MIYVYVPETEEWRTVSLFLLVSVCLRVYMYQREDIISNSISVKEVTALMLIEA